MDTISFLKIKWVNEKRLIANIICKDWTIEPFQGEFGGIWINVSWRDSGIQNMHSSGKDGRISYHIYKTV